MSKPTFIELPVELVEEICILLAGHDRQTSILNLIRTCRALRNVVTRFLYYDIDTSEWPGERMILFMATTGTRRSFIRRLQFKMARDGPVGESSMFRRPWLDQFLRAADNLQVLHYYMESYQPSLWWPRPVSMKALRHIILENLHLGYASTLNMIREAPKLEVLTIRNCWFNHKITSLALLANLKRLELIDIDARWLGSPPLEKLLRRCPRLESFALTTLRERIPIISSSITETDISTILSPYRNTLRHLEISWQCWSSGTISSLKDFTCLETIMLGGYDLLLGHPSMTINNWLPPAVKSFTIDSPGANLLPFMRRLGEAKQLGQFPNLGSFTQASFNSVNHYEAAEVERLSKEYDMKFRVEHENVFRNVRYRTVR
ncbi:unnamed protein product [Fusarium equiseti]|uniref:F-box domain-containing protein n=1 Tax=Fusarium equiseti TaxID=61235 RepID=A0A8J2J4N2_FUSEQ|nr:unnamed protein product [Fusarium equiseti]